MIKVEDFINMTPDEVVAVTSTKLEPRPELDKDNFKLIKGSLKGFFKDSPELIRTGQILHVRDYFVRIHHVAKSSKRVFFTVDGFEKEFSLSFNYLQDIENPDPFPYKIDDVIIFQGQEYPIKGINPASYNITIQTAEGKKKVNVSKVCPKPQNS